MNEVEKAEVVLVNPKRKRTADGLYDQRLEDEPVVVKSNEMEYMNVDCQIKNGLEVKYGAQACLSS